MQPNPLFRRQALDQLSSPEQLDQLVRLTSPWAWLALLGLAGLLVAALLWGIFGRIPSITLAEGVLVRPGGVDRVVAMESGQVREMLAALGEAVQAGQVVARLVPAGEKAGDVIDVVAPYGGQVIALTASRGDFVDAGTSLLTLAPEGSHLEAVFYLPLSDGRRIRSGMAVQLTPLAIKKEEYGYLLGTVSDVAEFPASAESMRRIVGNEELVRTFLAGGAPVEVHVDLQSDAATASGYRWSSSDGPAYRLDAGTPAGARIITQERRPIGLIVPAWQ